MQFLLYIASKKVVFLFIILAFIATTVIQAQPIQTDADADGMDDSWEMANGLDSADPTDAWTDLDADHVINLFEYQLDSNPNDGGAPAVLDMDSAGDLDALLNSLTGSTLIRVEAGSYLLNVDYDGGPGLEDVPIKVMIQGGWNSDFSSRDTAQETIFTREDEGRILDVTTEVEENTLILDGIIFSDQIALALSTNDSSYTQLTLHDVTVSGYQDTGTLVGALNIIMFDQSQLDMKMIRSTFSNNAGGADLTVSGAAQARVEILHSTITDNFEKDFGSIASGLDLAVLDSASIDAKITNSIIWGNQHDVLGSDLRALNNVTVLATYSNIGTVSEFPLGNYTAGDAVTDIDPGFVDATNGDYNLAMGSQLINAGLVVGLPFDGSAPDIGRFEFAESATSTEGVLPANAEAISIASVFPNPFVDVSRIEIDLDRSELLGIKIYDILGREVRSYPEKQQPAGKITFEWNGRDDSGGKLSAGVYFIRAQAGHQARTARVVLAD